MNSQEKLDVLVEHLEQEVPGFAIKYKEESWFQGTFIPKIAFFVNYEDYITTFHPLVWYPERDDVEKYPESARRILEHEAVHLLDMQTFFGLMPFLPKKLNYLVYSLLYAQAPLAFLALLAITGNLWWLLFLAFLLPIPAPFRAWAEVRGYRRSLELGSNLDGVVAQFTGSSYYFMWPFGKHIRKWLDGPSPYKEQFDSLYEE